MSLAHTALATCSVAVDQQVFLKLGLLLSTLFFGWMLTADRAASLILVTETLHNEEREDKGKHSVSCSAFSSYSFRDNSIVV